MKIRIGKSIEIALRRLRDRIRGGRKSRLRLLDDRMLREIAALRAHHDQLDQKLQHEIAVLHVHRDQIGKNLDAGLQAIEQLQSLEPRLAGVERLRIEPRLAAVERLSGLEPRVLAIEGLKKLPEHVFGLEQLLTQHPAWSPSRLRAELEQFPSPIVSVIMPTRNRARFIPEAISSVVSQRFTDWELIVVDDGSTDETEAALMRFSADSRIRYVRQPARNGSAARNHGLGLARDEFIAYLDSDNLMYPDFLTAAVNAMIADPQASVVYGALVTEHHGLAGTRLLWEPFDRARLLEGNYIDQNSIVHRKSLVDMYGGFDEHLIRLQDWDLLLRYTESAPAKRLPVLAALYRSVDDQRMSDTAPYGPDYLLIKRKQQRDPDSSSRPRILYVLWQYPQLSETYIETEIRYMLRHGVHVEVWSEAEGVALYPPSVPVYRGSLADAIQRVRPDILHVDWLNTALMHQAAIDQFRIPVTIRSHGFEFSSEAVAQACRWALVRAIYMFPHQLAELPNPDPRVRAIASAFDTELFEPRAEKDRRLVVRTAGGLPSKDLDFFFELAKRLPRHRFVLAAITCKDREAYIDYLKDSQRRSKTPAELMIDVPREQIAPLVARAGLYLHTACAPGEPYATPIGNPISIAEAMATGAHVLVRDLPPLVNYVGAAGSVYRDLDHAVEIVAATESWTDHQWRAVWLHSVNRAFMFHADELALRPILEDWLAILQESDRAAIADAAQ